MLSRTATFVEIVKECDKAFQNGGSKVQKLKTDGTLVSVYGDCHSVKRHADDGERVFHRRKLRMERRYHWVEVHAVLPFIQCEACKQYDADATCPQCPGRAAIAKATGSQQ